MRHAEAPYRDVLGAYESRAPERCAIAFNYVFDAFQQSYFFTLGLYGGTCVLVRDGLALLDVGDDQGSTRERNSQLQRLRSRPFSTRFG